MLFDKRELLLRLFYEFYKLLDIFTGYTKEESDKGGVFTV